MKIKGITSVKSFVMAGVVSVGLFGGVHMCEAAQGEAKTVKTVKVENASEVKNLEVKTNSSADKEKAQASVNASTTAKNHVCTNSAVHSQAEVTAEAEVKSEPVKEAVKGIKSAVNKVKSQASEHASENAKLHESENSAVHVQVKEAEVVGSEE